MIVHPRTDGKVHWIDAIVGDLYRDPEGAGWFVVTWLGPVKWDDGEPKRKGTGRPATIDDIIGVVMDASERLQRIEQRLLIRDAL